MTNSNSNSESFNKHKIARLESKINELNKQLEEQKKAINILLSTLDIAQTACQAGLTSVKIEAPITERTLDIYKKVI